MEHLPFAGIFCYGDEENARIYVVHLTTANQRIKLAKRVLSLLPSIRQKGPADLF